MEDGLALGMLLSPLQHKKDLADMSQQLELFDQVRRRRATRVQILSSVRAHREMDAQDSIRPYLEQGMEGECMSSVYRAREEALLTMMKQPQLVSKIE